MSYYSLWKVKILWLSFALAAKSIVIHEQAMGLGRVRNGQVFVTLGILNVIPLTQKY